MAWPGQFKSRLQNSITSLHNTLVASVEIFRTIKGNINILTKIIVCFFLSAGIVFGCKKEYSCEGCRSRNQPPIANAGSDLSISLPIDSIVLDGSASSDPDNDLISYGWTKISGPSSFSIANSNIAKPQVNNLVSGTYQFELKVTDPYGLFAIDTVQITVNNAVTNSCSVDNRPQIDARLVSVGTLSQGRFGFVMATAGKKILFAGGGNFGIDGCNEASSRVDIYDTETKNWSTAELSCPKWYVTAVTVGNKVFLPEDIPIAPIFSPIILLRLMYMTHQIIAGQLFS